MPVYIKPTSYDSWAELPSLTKMSHSDKWNASLRQTLSTILLAIKEYHYKIDTRADKVFPDRFSSGHRFWTWFDNTWREKLLGMLEDMPEVFDRDLGDSICAAAKSEGVIFGSV